MDCPSPQHRLCPLAPNVLPGLQPNPASGRSQGLICMSYSTNSTQAGPSLPQGCPLEAAPLQSPLLLSLLTRPPQNHPQPNFRLLHKLPSITLSSPGPHNFRPPTQAHVPLPQTPLSCCHPVWGPVWPGLANLVTLPHDDLEFCPPTMLRFPTLVWDAPYAWTAPSLPSPAHLPPPGSLVLLPA